MNTPSCLSVETLDPVLDVDFYTRCPAGQETPPLGNDLSAVRK